MTPEQTIRWNEKVVRVIELEKQLAMAVAALSELHIGVVALLLAEQDTRATIKMLSPLMTEALARANNQAAEALKQICPEPPKDVE